MTAEQFIKDYTQTCSNELIAVEDIHGKKVISYREWLTPEQALRAVELARQNLWHPADGNDLPEIDREVIALLSNGKVVYAHRPQEYWDGKNIITNEVTRYEPKRYDKGGWNQPNVKWWLDLDLPKMQE
jgi:hypothetical protein